MDTARGAFCAILCVVVVSVVGVAHAELYIHPDPQFSLSYPGGWIQSPTYSSLASFYDGDNWTSSIAVYLIEPMRGSNTNIAGRIADMEESMCVDVGTARDEWACREFELKSVEPVTIDGKRAFVAIAAYHARYPEIDGWWPTVSMTAYVLDDAGTWMVLTETDEDVYKTYEYDLRSAVDSFEAGQNLAPAQDRTGLAESAYVVYFDPLPEWAVFDVDAGLAWASDYWDGVDGVTFHRSFNPDFADFVVSWSKNYGHSQLGYNYMGLIDIGLGSDECAGVWNPYSQAAVARTLAHELGHGIGYGHAEDPGDLMHATGSVSYASETFNETMMVGYASFHPVCTIGDSVEYEYSFESAPGHKYDVFYVPSARDVDAFFDGQSYSAGCRVSAVSEAEGTCAVGSGGGFIVDAVDGSRDLLAEYRLVLREIGPSEDSSAMRIIGAAGSAQGPAGALETDRAVYPAVYGEKTEVEIRGHVPSMFDGKYLPVRLTISLDGMSVGYTKTSSGDDGGFSAVFSLPAGSKDGTYVVTARTSDVVIGTTSFAVHEQISAVPQIVRPSIDDLYQYALDLTNEERTERGLAPVTLSSVRSAQDHADDMLRAGYFSHWNTEGVKPYAAYTKHGGTGYVAENIARTSLECAAALCSPARLDPLESIRDAHWGMVYNDAHADWGHRDNILDPSHTHLNVGVAYDDEAFYFVQHFESNIVEWNEINLVGQTLVMDGVVTGGHLYSVGIFEDPAPAPLSARELNGAEPYSLGYYEWGQFAGVIVERLYGDWYYEECSGGIVLGDDCVAYTTWAADTWGDGRIRLSADVSWWLERGGLHTVVAWIDGPDGAFPASAVTLEYLP